MISDYDMQTAGKVLAKCASNDPWFPKGGESTVLAWAEVFADSGLSREDLLAGVTRAYRLAPEGFKPLPASIVRHSRDAYFESLKSLPEENRRLMDTVNEALQDMGFAPPDAHRFSRHVALGRTPGVELTEQQLTELRTKVADRQALEAEPSRPLGLGGIVKTVNEVLADA
ncbi:hypothetical protein ACFXG4_27320 [Nocardia sp. NPDC059246]|uniref:hypothetical protein n=1 Tax=unclassified Nocardia TaxID=2637762 RepID=UPI0036751A16